MVLEGIVTTRDAAGALHVAPMGPHVDAAMGRLRLRPFKTSQTFRNLVVSRCGVFHVIDDVLLLAQSAIGRFPAPPPTFPAETIAGDVLEQACRWYEFRIESVDDAAERAELCGTVTHSGRLRDFFGFNRGKNAVVEAAILATRLAILPREQILSQLEPLKTMVEKTGGPQEVEAFALVEGVIREHQKTLEPTRG